MYLDRFLANSAKYGSNFIILQLIVGNEYVENEVASENHHYKLAEGQLIRHFQPSHIFWLLLECWAEKPPFGSLNFITLLSGSKLKCPVAVKFRMMVK